MESSKRRGNKARLRLSTIRKKNKGGKSLLTYFANKKVIADERINPILTEESPSTSNCENVDFHDARESRIIETEDFLVEGRRIVDINQIISAFKELSDHGQKYGCSFANMDLIGEARDGLKSYLQFKCNMCNYEQKVCTDGSVSDINKCSVMGLMNIGCGYAQLEQLLASIEVPCMSNTKYRIIHDSVSNAWQETAIESMKEAAEEEKKIALENGRICSNGMPMVRVICDGSWAKRSYRSGYSSLSGCAAIVGANTKKVLHIGVLNKFCYICKMSENSNERKDHICNKNYEGSSSGMEATILMQGFQLSVPLYGIIYDTFISDGDSSTYKKLLDVSPYKDYGITITKIECRNHLLRNYCSKVRKLVEDRKMGPLILRKKLKANQMRLRMAIVKAIEFRKAQTGSSTSKATLLADDIKNAPSHIFGEHRRCIELGYFCKKPFENQSVFSDMKHSDIYEKLADATNYVAKHAASLIIDEDNNAVEQFNSIIAKFTGGKRINFVTGKSYNARCFGAALSFNTKTPMSIMYSKMNKCKKPATLLTKLETRNIRRNKLRMGNRVKAKLNKKKTFNKKSNDEDYGPNCAKPDIEEVEMKIKSEEFLATLKCTMEEIRLIERETQGQADSIKWHEVRKYRLTASMFGEVCKRRAKTSCHNLVKNILHPPNLHCNSIRHGKANENVAIMELTNILNMDIKTSGIFVDENYPYLAATPDGIIGTDSIVEVKCPYSAKDLTPEEGILARKITFWTKEGKINTNHKWYFQVQGQLHIANKKICHFAVWTTKGMKVEQIERDEDFWNKKMKESLIKFYLNCILPEIIDSRLDRSMKIRDPQYIIDCQK